jgi:hypothetical protein
LCSICTWLIKSKESNTSLLSRPLGRQGGTIIIARAEPTNSDELPAPSDVTFPVFGDDLRTHVIRFFK